jgi:hypothetical protein
MALVTRAVLEASLYRYVAVHHGNGFDLLESAYGRALEKLARPTTMSGFLRAQGTSEIRSKNKDY